jgi:4-aminobutyrate aminotransferase-like enzyme
VPLWLNTFHEYTSTFLSHLAQTSPAPIGIEMVKAEGVYLYDVDGKQYIDGISGFSVANITIQIL